MRKYIFAVLIVLLTCQMAFGSTYASKLDRVSDADMKTAVLRGGLTVADFQGGGLTNSGNVYYVDSVNGADNRSGRSWALAVATINQARILAAAARSAGTDDGKAIIYARESHAETITGSSALVANLSGTTYRGVGRTRPILTFSPTSANETFLLPITGTGTVFSGFRFTVASAHYDALIDYPIHVNADDVVIVDCEFIEPDKVTVDTWIATAGSKIDNFTLDNCFHQGTTSGSAQGQGDGFVMLRGGRGHKIINNTSSGNFDFGNVQVSSISFGGTIDGPKDLLIEKNFFQNTGSSVAACIFGTVPDATGWINKNTLNIQPTISMGLDRRFEREQHVFQAGSMTLSENYGSWLTGYSATLVGTVNFEP
ncbi:hypothetical protein LCGC14_1064860 [marine sediment metagenome]|uniref:Right handed beta helix domain-containing protein n=1 Tax=marine sediment metagenome TaxID=412755 RepID=A0A0F9MJX2_9ZZZZ|nr:hypothetical protein [Pricia sp.]